MRSARLFAVAAASVLLWAGPFQPFDRPAVAQETRQRAEQGGGQRPTMEDVLILFRNRPGQAEEALVRSAGGAVRHRYTSVVDAVAARVPSQAIQGLQNNPNVVVIEPDIEARAIHLGDSSPAEVANAWGVDRLDAELVHARGDAGKGSGVRLAIVDSGSGPHQWDLRVAARLGCIGQSCRLGSGAGYDDDNGHGTHAAGSAAAVASYTNDPGATQTYGGVVGMAPQVTLISLKVLKADGGGAYSDILAALDWLVGWSQTNGNQLQIANFSLGSARDPGTIVRTAFDNAYNNFNVLTIAAAGNAGNTAGRGDNIIYPAKYDSVVAVAAVDSGDRRAGFSSTGAKVELSAPGVNIWSTHLRDGYGYMSGTSMASPHAAGAAALRAALFPGT